MEKKNKSVVVLLIITLCVFIVLLGGVIVSKYIPFDKIFKTETVQKITKKEVTITDEGIADAVEKLYDATVVVKVGASANKLSGWGSGFVYKVDDHFGYILTNHHVVEGTNYIQIEFADHTLTDGILVGSDQHQDVAVVKVSKDKVLKVAEMGDSEKLRVGDTVFAIGTPISLNYSFTVTRGILSGKDRLVGTSANNNNSVFSTNTDSWYMKLLQIDASINSGNSGGPLANSNGEVVGITNSKLSSSYSSTSIENMGFAIPIEDAISLANLIEQGKQTAGSGILFGVTMTDVNVAAYNDISVDPSIKSGAVVVEVVEGSNASRAGLKKGDVIISYDGNKIPDYKYLKYYISKNKAGDKVSITYIRDGKEKTTEVTLKD